MSDALPSRSENLVLLLSQHQEALLRYIFSLVTFEADARDILQKTCLALYRKSEQFDGTRPFLPWAYRFAYLQVQKYREKSERSPLLFSEDVMDLLANERSHLEPMLDARLRWLDKCLAKLSPLQKNLVTSRYGLRERVEELMKRFDMSRRTLFRNLEMLRQQLHECVTRHLAEESMP
jgi:RNA polymerase sigma-70 factor (ECF subfamily)